VTPRLNVIKEQPDEIRIYE